MKKFICLIALSLAITTPSFAAPGPHGGPGGRPPMHGSVSMGHRPPMHRPPMHHHVGMRPPIHPPMYRPMPIRPIYRPYYYSYYPSTYYSTYTYYTPETYTYTPVTPVTSSVNTVVVREDPYAGINTAANIINTAANVASTIRYLTW